MHKNIHDLQGKKLYIIFKVRRKRIDRIATIDLYTEYRNE